MLYNLIKNQIEKLELSVSKLAKAVNIDRSTIKRYLDGNSEMMFHNMITIVKYLFPQSQQHDILDQYARNITKPDNLKSALEYASTNRNYPLCQYLIDKQMDMTTTGNDDYAKIYNILLRRRKGELSPHQVMELCKNEKAKTKEMNILLQIIFIYALYDLRKRELAIEYAKEIHESILEIKHEYFRTSFIIRLSEVLGYTTLKSLGNKEKAREYASNIIDDKYVNESIKASAYFCMAETYFFESYEKSIENFVRAAEIYDLIGNYQFATNVKQFSMMLLKLVHGKLNEVSTADPVLNALYHAMKGDSAKASDYLIQDMQTLASPAMSMYVKGIALKDISLLYDSLGMFIGTGDFWYVNLPRFELFRLGEPEYAVDAVIKYKIPHFKEVNIIEKTSSSNVVNFDRISGRNRTS